MQVHEYEKVNGAMSMKEFAALEEQQRRRQEENRNQRVQLAQRQLEAQAQGLNGSAAAAGPVR